MPNHPLRGTALILSCQLLILGLLILLTGACQEPARPAPARLAPDNAAIQQQIEAEIARSVAATRNEDIDAYMDGLPEDLVIYDESGAVVTRDEQRARALRDWAVITRTLDIAVVVDSLIVSDDSTAMVYTAQRWQRMMLRPDRPGEDTVLTTQRHRELWQLTARGWRNVETEELGGHVWVNGAPYPGG